MLDSRRRKFIALLASTAAWPLAARAPQKPVWGSLSAKRKCEAHSPELSHCPQTCPRRMEL